MALRAKLNKLGVVMRERQSKVDEQISDIDKHNAIINTTEKEMLRLRKKYEVPLFSTVLNNVKCQIAVHLDMRRNITDRAQHQGQRHKKQ
jgi:hypothetical protein